MSDDNKPTAPESWECCGGGCSPCVWDHYYKALDAWNSENGIEAVKAVEPSIDTSQDHLFR